MGCHVTVANAPLDGRVGEDLAIIAGWKFQNFLAAFTFFHDGMAGATIESAAFVRHEQALNSFFDSCTNHGYHVLSLEYGPKAVMPQGASLKKRNILAV